MKTASTVEVLDQHHAPCQTQGIEHRRVLNEDGHRAAVGRAQRACLPKVVVHYFGDGAKNLSAMPYIVSEAGLEEISYRGA